MIDKLNSGVQEKHALLLKDLEMQKPTQPLPSNRTNEEDDLKKKLGKMEIFLFYENRKFYDFTEIYQWSSNYNCFAKLVSFHENSIFKI